ncbi:MAG TPA: bifunctional phosphoribosyl-AMP cyclohydrolase/phosphoribosyl-ATP diphosphatase HisIE [Candidatus Limnocylindrales bacterium]|nr:bifunctional phosphoribosyl-AMP cyclohydrolase/phosphoribosyl-ATP diphosphatase HisIE [Candidatus Limnocylindrales bacterium]
MPADLRRPLDPDAVRWGADGLVPAIVQDSRDGTVLMLGWQDRAALEATLSSGEVYFHSRSRGTLWRKGESSGNVLGLVQAALDCDGDTVLLAVEPIGPTCHTGARSCFDAYASASAQDFAWLEVLWSTIADRAATRPEGSYTALLLGGGVDAVARKVAEEATETVLAAKDDALAERSGSERTATREALAGELADLLYHALVLAAERDLEPRAIIDALRARSQRPTP